MYFKKIGLTILVITSLVQQSNAVIFSKESVGQFISNHKIFLKKSAIGIGFGLGLYALLKKLYATEDKIIATFDDGVVIKHRTLKHFPRSTSYFMMYKQDKYVGLIVCMRFLNQHVLANFSIIKNLRNNGYGTRLLKTTIDKLTQDDSAEIYLDANPFENNGHGIGIALTKGLERNNNLEKLIKWYEQNGFEGIKKEVAKNKVFFFGFMDLSYPMQYKAS